MRPEKVAAIVSRVLGASLEKRAADAVDGVEAAVYGGNGGLSAYIFAPRGEPATCVLVTPGSVLTLEVTRAGDLVSLPHRPTLLASFRAPARRNAVVLAGRSVWVLGRNRTFPVFAVIFREDCVEFASFGWSPAPVMVFPVIGGGKRGRYYVWQRGTARYILHENVVLLHESMFALGRGCPTWVRASDFARMVLSSSKGWETRG